MDYNVLKKYCDELPSRMEYETNENKKSGYIALTKEIAERTQAVLVEYELKTAVLWVVTLADTLEVTSPELYENYRAIADDFRKVLLHILVHAPLTVLEQDTRDQIAYAIRKACGMQLMLSEKYLPIAQKLSPMKVEDEQSEEVQSEEELYNGVHKGDHLDVAILSENAPDLQVALILATGRSATIAVRDGGRYYTNQKYHIYVDGAFVKETDTVITTIYGLEPNTRYKVSVVSAKSPHSGDGAEDVYETADGSYGKLNFKTLDELLTINVRDLGAKGDGIQDDTHFIQAAILTCPVHGRVLIPAGTYRITQLFLKSHVRIELAKGAELRADRDREKFAHYPALAEYTDESGEMYLGTWEGNPLPMYAGIISGVQVEDVILYGEGVVNGNASHEDWWKDPKVMRTAFRPRTFFINGCKNIRVQGVTFCNSPSWTIHPFFSDDLVFANVTVNNPSDSPNTDGLDPESCKNVDIVGVKFSLGDDCIAVKSGKIYMGRRYKRPSEDIFIHQCLMENGHGAVTIGSEMAGGVTNLKVRDCVFNHTDRGLRIKTRRGRGEDAIIDEIIFKNIDMDHVMTPFVVNSFYFCDPDGRTPYVQSRDPYPVDEGTPYIKNLHFLHINAKNCHVAAAHFDGLPERKIDEIRMEDVQVSYADNPKCDVPAMSEGVEKCSLKGIFANNIKKLVLKNVQITGNKGETIETVNVDEIVR